MKPIFTFLKISYTVFFRLEDKKAVGIVWLASHGISLPKLRDLIAIIVIFYFYFGFNLITQAVFIICDIDHQLTFNPYINVALMLITLWTTDIGTKGYLMLNDYEVIAVLPLSWIKKMYLKLIYELLGFKLFVLSAFWLMAGLINYHFLPESYLLFFQLHLPISLLTYIMYCLGIVFIRTWLLESYKAFYRYKSLVLNVVLGGVLVATNVVIHAGKTLKFYFIMQEVYWLIGHLGFIIVLISIANYIFLRVND